MICLSPQLESEDLMDRKRILLLSVYAGTQEPLNNIHGASEQMNEGFNIAVHFSCGQSVPSLFPQTR